MQVVKIVMLMIVAPNDERSPFALLRINSASKAL